MCICENEYLKMHEAPADLFVVTFEFLIMYYMCAVPTVTLWASSNSAEFLLFVPFIYLTVN